MGGFFKWSVRNKLIVTFAIILIVPSIAIGWLSYQTAANKIQEQMLASAQQNVDLLNQMIDKIVKPEMQDVDLLSQQIKANQFQGASSPLVRTTMKTFAALHPEIMNTYEGSATGLMILEPPQSLPSGFDPRTRPWYQAAKQAPGQVVITDPYINATDNSVVVTIAKMNADGSGVMAVDVNLKALGQVVRGVKIGQKGFAAIMDNGHKYLIHPTVAAGTVAKGDWVNAMYNQDSGQQDFVANGQEQMMFYAKNSLTGWRITGTMFKSEITQQAQAVFAKTAIVVLVALVVGALLVWLIIRSIMQPLHRLVQVSEKVSRGDLTDRIDLHSGDEFSILGETFNRMSDSLVAVLREVSETAVQLAASSQQLTAGSEQTSQATEHIAVTVQELAVGTDKQVQSIEESSRAIGEMSAGVKQIAGNAHLVASTSTETLEMASEGNQAIRQAVSQMESISGTVNRLANAVKGLGDRSQQIGEIVQVITDIATQTNLLALNAAIEAARAGEHGRGFAVVADEVRRLAEQSSQSAQQIADLILTIQAETSGTVQAMETGLQEVNAGIQVVHVAGETFEQIQHSVNEVTIQIQEVSAAAQQLAVATEQVVGAIHHISGVAELASSSTQNVSAASEEQLASMQEIAASANNLSEVAEHLQTLLGQFKVE